MKNFQVANFYMRTISGLLEILWKTLLTVKLRFDAPDHSGFMN